MSMAKRISSAPMKTGESSQSSTPMTTTPRRSKRKCAQQRLSDEIIKAESRISRSKRVGSNHGSQVTRQRSKTQITSARRPEKGRSHRVVKATGEKVSKRIPDHDYEGQKHTAAGAKSMTDKVEPTRETVVSSSGHPQEKAPRHSRTLPTEADKNFFCCPKCCTYFARQDYHKFRVHLNEDCLVKKRLPCQLCGHIYASQNILDHHMMYMHKNPHPKSKILKTKPRKEFLHVLQLQQGSVDAAKKDSGVPKKLEEDEWPEDEEKAEYLASLKGVWRCWICFYESQQKGLWSTHMNRIHPDAVGITFPCELCKVSFQKKHHLREHLHEVHPDNSGYTCEECGRKFLHKNLQHLCEKIQCEVCGEVFRSRRTRAKHMLIHPEYRPYKCEECPKKFQKKEYLTLHMRVHKNLRPYSCDYCDKSFRSKSHYNNHKRLHTGEKPYVCHTCGRCFFSPQGLHSHLTSHVGDKTESCKTCGKSFRTANELRRHEFIHSGSKPHSCKYCQKSFNRRSNCLVHEKSHENVREHPCDLCGSKFNKLKKLERHKAKDHKERWKTGPESQLQPAIDGPTMAIHGPGPHDDASQSLTFVQLEDVASNVEIS